MDRSSPESYGDGDDSEPISRRGGKRSSRDGGAAAPYAVPLVIRTAAAAARSTPTRAPGYSPKLSMDMASAHSWAPYTAVIPALRALSLKSLGRGPGADLELEAAKELLAGLYGHAAPFAAARRFPEGEVYVCLDRAPFASKIQWIQQHLMRAEVSYGDDLTRACAGYASGIGSALDEITRVDDRRGGAPVLYDRAAFESAFLLTWTQP